MILVEFRDGLHEAFRHSDVTSGRKQVGDTLLEAA
jgi:hypothetical protein